MSMSRILKIFLYSEVFERGDSHKMNSYKDITKYNLMRNEKEHVREYKYLGFVFTSNGINRLTKQEEKAWFAVQKICSRL